MRELHPIKQELFEYAADMDYGDFMDFEEDHEEVKKAIIWYNQRMNNEKEPFKLSFQMINDYGVEILRVYMNWTTTMSSPKAVVLCGHRDPMKFDSMDQLEYYIHHHYVVDATVKTYDGLVTICRVRDSKIVAV